MNEAGFRAWLETSYSPNTVQTKLSEARQLDRAYGDLDGHFDSDRLASVMESLRYSSDDKARNRPNPSKVNLTSDLYRDLGNLRTTVNYYIRFREEGEPRQLREAEREGLERMKIEFLDRVPDFHDFEQTEGPYWDLERSYKQAMIAEARVIATSSASDAEAGHRIYDILCPQAGPPLRWQTIDAIHKGDPGLANDFDTVLGRLARSDAPVVDAIMEAVERLETLRAKGLPSCGNGEVLANTFGIAAAIRPEEAAFFRVNKARRLLERLGHPLLFRRQQVNREEVEAWFGLLHRIFTVMRDDWQWRPRDLLDVQGFAWVVLSDGWDDAQADDDEELLRRFDGNPKLREARQAWSDEQRSAFCAMARAAHEVGLDWYNTNIPETRFGRKVEASRDAIGTLGSVQLRKDRAFLQFSHQHQLVGIEGEFEIDMTGADRFSAEIGAAEEAVSKWLPLNPSREGRWPDAYGDTSQTSLEDGPNMTPTNLILYGPPGTGKTYATAAEAVKLCDGSAPEDRDLLMKRYRELEAEKRIAFVTFHQNYDYESFVEGLRPETGENESASAGFRLEARAGIFREVCALAEQARTRAAPASGGAGYDFSGRRFWKMGQGTIGSEDDVYDAAIANNYITLGWGGSIDWSSERFSSFEAIKAEWLEKSDDTTPSNWTQMWPFRCEMKIGDIVIVPYGNTAFRAIAEVTGDYRFEPSAEGYYAHRRNVRWLLTLDEPLPLDTIVDGNFTMRTLYSLPSKRVNLPALGRLIAGDAESTGADPIGDSVEGSPDQFVLIIDEINRANISKVFGELITLIEPDKRLGMPNALTLALPYSKKRDFGVPSNLHIIGTMNTADRSIALLDTALRRRFVFREIEPDHTLLPDEIDGVPLRKVLQALNDRVEYLVDRERRIGHAFFMGDGGSSRAAIDRTMRDKVIPLLQEYFFEDWARVATVLGEEPGEGGAFLDCRKLPDPTGQDGEQRESWCVRKVFAPNAYDRLIGKTKSVESDAPSDEGAV